MLGLKSDRLNPGDDCLCSFLEYKFGLINIIGMFFHSYTFHHLSPERFSLFNLFLCDDSHCLSSQLLILSSAVSQNMITLNICVQGSCVGSRD